MFDKSAIKQNFSRAAQKYDEFASLQKTVRARAIKTAEEYFPKKAKILDLGCATAALVEELKNREIIGCDISFGMCKTARNKTPLIVNADAARLPFADESFNGVFSSLMLQWADNRSLVIKEILRVLKPEGTAIITVFVEGTLEELKTAFAGIDSFPHVSDFSHPADLLVQTAHNGAIVIEAHENTYTEYYDDLLSLMRSLKNIGAGNKMTGRKKSLTTRSQFAAVEQAYKKEKNKYPAGWKVLTMIIGKA